MANQEIVQTVAYRGMRNFKKDAYHYCVRCGSRVQIQDLEWQRALLVCKKWDCVDYGNHGNYLVGQREAEQAQVLSIPTQELIPDEKFTDPSSGDGNPEDDIIF